MFWTTRRQRIPILLWKMEILLPVETLRLTFARQWDTISNIFEFDSVVFSTEKRGNP